MRRWDVSTKVANEVVKRAFSYRATFKKLIIGKLPITFDDFFEFQSLKAFFNLATRILQLFFYKSTSVSKYNYLQTNIDSKCVGSFYHHHTGIISRVSKDYAGGFFILQRTMFSFRMNDRTASLLRTVWGSRPRRLGVP